MKPKEPQQRLFEKKDKSSTKYEKHHLFEITIEDIFKKYDLHNKKVLGYYEFKGFCDCIGRSMSPKQFKEDCLKKFSSARAIYEDGSLGEFGITVDGLKEFFHEDLRVTGK